MTIITSIPSDIYADNSYNCDDGCNGSWSELGCNGHKSRHRRKKTKIPWEVESKWAWYVKHLHGNKMSWRDVLPVIIHMWQGLLEQEHLDPCMLLCEVPGGKFKPCIPNLPHVSNFIGCHSYLTIGLYPKRFQVTGNVHLESKCAY